MTLSSNRDNHPEHGDGHPPTAAAAPSPFFHPRVNYESCSIVEETISSTRSSGSVTVVGGVDLMENKSGVLGCVVNLMTCIVGSGIVGLPFAIKQAGLVAGVALVLLTATITGKSLRMLIETAKHVHKQSYETTAEVAFGPIGFRFILINMFIMAYGAMVTYLMITKDCASLLLGIAPDESLYQELVLLVISLGIQLPLACLRDMADLEKTSGLAVLIDCAIVGLVVWTSPWQQGIQAKGGFFELAQTDIIHWDSIFVGLGVLSFAFECQEAVFIVAGSLDKPTAARWSSVTWIALSCCCGLALTCAMSGYFGYFDLTQGNVLNNLDPTLPTSKMAHAMLGLTMFATYPLASFVARHVCVVLLFSGKQAHEGDDPAILNRADRRILLTTALYICALVPATVFTDMGSVLALAGVVGGSCLAYIGPGMLYLAVHGGRFLQLVEIFFLVSDGAATGVAMGESTPLVVHPGSSTGVGGGYKRFKGPFQALLWYLGGFPIWCYIAEMGRKGVLARAQTLARDHNTAEGRRIGNVDFKGMEHYVMPPRSIESDDKNVDTKKQIDVPRSGSNPRFKCQQDNDPDVKDWVEERGSGKVEKQPSLPKSIPSLGADPQAEPPVIQDFAIALFFVLYGVLALFCGLVSLSS
jgi:solute carrier family 38 (sodium-coupled neutral amino acid transporter), member 11